MASAGSGTVAGGIVGSLIALGVGDQDAEFVSQEIDAGSPIVVVKNLTDRDETMPILGRTRTSFAPSLRRPPSGELTGILAPPLVASTRIFCLTQGP